MPRRCQPDCTSSSSSSDVLRNYYKNIHHSRLCKESTSSYSILLFEAFSNSISSMMIDTSQFLAFTLLFFFWFMGTVFSIRGMFQHRFLVGALHWSLCFSSSYNSDSGNNSQSFCKQVPATLSRLGHEVMV